jgi:hypothetical protein
MPIFAPWSRPLDEIFFTENPFLAALKPKAASLIFFPVGFQGAKDAAYPR